MKIELDPYPIIETERLRLRALEVGDAEVLFKLRSNESVNRYLDRPPTSTISDAQAFIDKIAAVTANKHGIYWVITLKNSGEFAGTSCMWNFDADKDTTEIGYELLPDHGGQGIMNEALQAVISYAFGTMQLKAILAVTHPDNAASSKLLKRNGFVLDGSNEFVSKEDAGGQVAYYLKANN